MLYLTVVGANGSERRFSLKEGSNLVGRIDPELGIYPDVDLDQDDPEARVSRRHASICIGPSIVTIEDLGSMNGSYLNMGSRLSPGVPIEMRVGDEVLLGKTVLRLESAEDITDTLSND